MKTNELVRQLQEIDPSGELECCINNHDILFVERTRAFYDGPLEILVRDTKGQVVGGVLRRIGEKVRVRLLDLESAVWDWDSNPAFVKKYGRFPIEIEAIDETDRRYLEQTVQRWREAATAETDAS